MDWLTDWDDLKHGTVVFSAAVPFLVAIVLAWRLPDRFWWVSVVAALVGPFLWLFGVPKDPPASSEDVAVAGLALAVVALLVSPRLTWMGRVVIWCVLFAGLAWSVYPAWLADEGGVARKLLVCGSMTVSIAVIAALAESGSQAEGNFRVSIAVFIPPTIALAVLLQLGGAARFGQAAGALAAALGAHCVLLIVQKSVARPAFLAALSGMFIALLAWSGWLFAELRYGLALLLLLAPVAGALVNLIPLPRGHAFLNQLWDGLASAAVSAIPAWVAISDYFADASEFESY